MKIGKNYFKSNKFTVSIAILIILNLFLLYFLIKKTPSTEIEKTSSPSEIQKIKLTADPHQGEKLYTQLIERVGPVKAQEDLYHSGLPFTGQTHLLNHTVGEWIYKKYGIKGLPYCKDYFLSSCYHGFVINAIAEHGLKILPQIMDNCYKNGVPTTMQCSHAIGHGLLAWEGYANLPKALKRCEELASSSTKFPVYNCQDGVFMENIWAVHDDGTPSPDRWINKSDITYPCSDPRIGPEYQRPCWSNQPQLIYQYFTQDLKKIAQECDKLPDEEVKWTCYDSIARQIHPDSKGNIDTTFKLCSQLPGKWGKECILSNVSASYSVGDRINPYAICLKMPTSDRDDCYNRLLNMIMTYSKSENERIIMCQKITDKSWRNTCIKNPQ